jgi:hypothetical protein
MLAEGDRKLLLVERKPYAPNRIWVYGINGLADEFRQIKFPEPLPPAGFANLRKQDGN